MGYLESEIGERVLATMLRDGELAAEVFRRGFLPEDFCDWAQVQIFMAGRAASSVGNHDFDTRFKPPLLLDWEGLVNVRCGQCRPSDEVELLSEFARIKAMSEDPSVNASALIQEHLFPGRGDE